MAKKQEKSYLILYLAQNGINWFLLSVKYYECIGFYSKIPFLAEKNSGEGKTDEEKS